MGWLHDEMDRASQRRAQIPVAARTNVVRPDRAERELRQFLGAEYGFSTAEQDEVVRTVIDAASRAWQATHR